jgi:hypothetical protein
MVNLKTETPVPFLQINGKWNKTRRKTIYYTSNTRVPIQVNIEEWNSNGCIRFTFYTCTGKLRVR